MSSSGSDSASTSGRRGVREPLPLAAGHCPATSGRKTLHLLLASILSGSLAPSGSMSTLLPMLLLSPPLLLLLWPLPSPLH